MSENPLLAEWQTDFGIPPFDHIRDSDFAPAFEASVDEASGEIARIAGNPEPATFVNTIEAMERADRLLERVVAVFWNLTSSQSNDTLRELERDFAPKLAAFESEVVMNDRLFSRIEALYDQIGEAGQTAEQERVLELYHLWFVRSGAKLVDEDRSRFVEVVQRLAELGAIFSQNVLADEREWILELKPHDMEGCPGFLEAAARQAASERGKDGISITLSRSLVMPFLQFSSRRDLREIAYSGWVSRGQNGGDTDNRSIIREILALREEKAKLLGYESFAAFRLETQMAKQPDAVRTLLRDVWAPAAKAARHDGQRLAELMHTDGINDELRNWDWQYYAEKLRVIEHDLDEAEIKPYFQLENMIDAVFFAANRLFGLEFSPVDLPLYHQDARAWEVRKNGRHMAIFIGDYFARPSKQSGAWCSEFRSQTAMDGDVRPITLNVCNFAKPPEGEPCLLTVDDARTLFHEFGHALHSMLSDVRYKFISGLSVVRDFVELPSQLFEHWLFVPEVLSRFAIHARTGEAMPESLVRRLLAARNFDEGFRSVEYIASALVDLSLHEQPAPADPEVQESSILKSLGMPPAIAMRHASPHFQHVFAGEGYASGYYSYLWSEVLDADAFAAFEEAGDPFDSATAGKLHDCIYAAGASRDAEDLYTSFRGSLPTVDALLKKRGFEPGGVGDIQR